VAIPVGVLLAGRATIDFRVAIPTMGFLGLVTIVFTRTDLELSDREACVLLILYAVFVCWVAWSRWGSSRRYRDLIEGAPREYRDDRFRSGRFLPGARRGARMSEKPRVVALCGSLRERSHTRVALGQALDAASDRGARTDLVDLRSLDVPIYDADEEDVVDVSELKRRVRAGDSILLGTPMYHGSYASPLKTALDYCGFDEFENRTVGLLAVSGGSFPVTALDHLRAVCRALDAWVLPHQAAIPNASKKIEDGEIVDPSIADRVAVLGERAVEYANIEPGPACFESEENVGALD